MDANVSSVYGKGEPIGNYDINPFLNTKIYNVGFPDGEIRDGKMYDSIEEVMNILSYFFF